MAGNACPVFRHSVISEQKQKAFLQGAHLPVDLSLSDSDLSPADAPWEKLDSAFKPLLSISRPHLQEAALNTVGVYILVSKMPTMRWLVMKSNSTATSPCLQAGLGALSWIVLGSPPSLSTVKLVHSLSPVCVHVRACITCI